MSSFLCFGQSVGQTSSIEDYLANSHYPSSGCSGLAQCQTLRLLRLLGQLVPARLWLNPEPNVKFPRLSGQITCSRLWLNLVGPTNFEDWACSACSPHPSGQIDSAVKMVTAQLRDRTASRSWRAVASSCEFVTSWWIPWPIFEVPSINFHSLVLFLCYIMLF